jgi:hypothetical protein
LITLKELKADIIGISETSTNWKNNKVLDKFKTVLYKDNRNNRMAVSCATIEHSSNYLPGGTASIIRGKWSSHYKEDIHDTSGMGRWSGVKIRTKENQYLHHITAYRVCKQKVNKTNSSSTFSQQFIHLLSSGINIPNPRQQILDDLGHYLQTIDPNDYMVLNIDANEPMSEPNSKMLEFINKNNLTDAYTYIHNNDEFSTHLNGSKRIDFILCSNNVRPYITKTGALQYHDGLLSNHRGIFCDISANLFNNNIEERIVKSRQIGTNSSNNEGETYVLYLDQQFINHRVYKKIKT